MMVVDTNIIAYLYLPSPYSESVEQLFTAREAWFAPRLWRSEFRNVLALYLRKKLISLENALGIIKQAESLMTDAVLDPTSYRILSLVSVSDCSAYDCEFVALAQQLDMPLVTQDNKLLREFPETAINIADALSINSG